MISGMRFRPRFSLRTFFIGFTLVSLWIGLSVRWKIERDKLLEHISASGGIATTSKVSWRMLFGDVAIEKIIMPTLSLDERTQLKHAFPEARILACADCSDAYLRTYGYCKTRYTYYKGRYFSRTAQPVFSPSAE